MREHGDAMRDRVRKKRFRAVSVGSVYEPPSVRSLTIDLKKVVLDST